ncbi:MULTISPECIES: Mini-ribonuclease 3 [unclassified Granulicatella]|uniref:Mini-ribonuclease 3 n=1 Tax=unclassified Granulicatella TaxID=2630493 RepID=UPI0010740E4B|nr:MULTISPECIES: Mini-ribonuclease 3 [unclassified Granulicatella]MBF0780445.1 Mini-ribonuclease 3 [Granulicatella sp. 19428wC4_WM01]TFU95389.1 Mini-ribonuclease 3 [Granulicatella sp. WM01]
MKNVEQLNGLTLAYIGDAIYELYIREYLINQGITKPNHLHKTATKYVSAKAQAMLMKAMLQDEIFLSEKEKTMYKRGRNTKSHTSAKNTDIMTYRVATGFETLIGYLYLEKQEMRLQELCQWCTTFIGEKYENN